MRALVLSYRHGLLPFAYRLHREGNDVTVATWRDRYDGVWAGGPLALTPREQLDLPALVQQAEGGDLAVMTDVRGLTPLRQAKHLYGPCGELPLDATVGPLRLGGWLTATGEVAAPHLLLVNESAWPLGVGPMGPGAVTLARLDHLPEQLEPAVGVAVQLLKDARFAGLFQLTVDEQLQLVGLGAGWGLVHSHAFLSELEGLGDVLQGGRPVLGARYVVAVPLSVAPWPRGQTPPAEPVPITLPSDLQGRVFWHDVTMEGGQLRGAGTDGLLGVARGAGSTATVARQRALGVAMAMGVPGLQWRPDAAGNVEQVLAQLEELGLLG